MLWLSSRGAAAARGRPGAGEGRVHQTQTAAGGGVQPEESQVQGALLVQGRYGSRQPIDELYSLIDK